ncbi:HAL/PAL/TAL family ammonia-lyase [Nocardia huaxiensis]|uniref:Aromatic amino acid lyase n=1 Tax=Nocardia huaxiensis TaxID=2755382 RepID=A0A7D6V8Z0_9NOCA|nr:aromatic amino acid ammonia-lyase [Nocardia huaxiensis]QLY30561.1 aromatic amino acid lyase [Nocardia huaxiensis]UFS95835.1 aromatic amino acid ammonia-lyase [Nocardia huaxiensis]
MTVSSVSACVLRFPGLLTARDLEAARGPIRVELSESALARIGHCREFVDELLHSGRPIYGATTGYGALVGFSAGADMTRHSQGLVDFLSVGQGPPLAPELVRAMLLARVWSLAQGNSGVSPEVVTALIEVLTTGLAPVVPEYGSVGASGDLVPLAHAIGALMGRGEIIDGGIRLPAAQALSAVGLPPLTLAGRDGLALVNGTALTSAAAGFACARAARSVTAGLALTALLAEILGVETEFASEALVRAAGHQGAVDAARLLRTRLAGARPSGLRPLQEPYSLRCVPQLAGAVLTSVRHATAVVTADLNGVSDNPLFFPDTGEVVHGGNFFGQPVAFAADLLSSALTQLANLAERQLDLLMDPHRNTGLPPSLSAAPGREHGLTGVQIAATATVVAMRRAAVPAAMQSLPTNQNNQDIVPFGTQAALTAYEQAGRLRWVHGSLALALRQARYLGGRAPRSEAGAALSEELCAAIAPVDPDRPLDVDIRRAADLLDDLFACCPEPAEE